MSFALRTVVTRGGIGPAPPKPPRRRRDRSYSGWLIVGLRRVTWVDLVVAGGVAVLLYGVLAFGLGATDAVLPGATAAIDTSPARLPYYAFRSVARMFVALAFSYLFTLGYATLAARSRRAGALLIPALDILQSVPVLGFLSITVTGFVALFPTRYLGLELASIFAIFTAQAWNLTFSFYHSLITQPRDLDEAARLLGLSRWRRFWKLDLPNGAIGLVWNGMMSMGGAWFFLVASEAISVNNQTSYLPGVGSFAAAAIDAGDLGKVALALLTMAVVVLAVNVVFWRPLVAWAEKFKNEQTEAADAPRSLVLDLVRRSHWPRVVGAVRRRLAEPVNRLGDRVFGPQVGTGARAEEGGAGGALFWLVALGLIGFGLWRLLRFVTAEEGLGVFVEPVTLGAVTLARVAVLVAVASLVWVPVGVWIGLRPKASRVAQPLVQVLASFPANFAFPFAVWVFLRTGLSIEVGGIVLMALGAQWYLLFNAIAGAQAIPSDLIEAMDDFGVTGWLRWRHFLLPAIFPAYVTGAITAAGGAWNASIVAEVVTYADTTLQATGLGAYISDATTAGDFPRVLAGVVVMAGFVVGLNRLFWQRLYRLAERRFAL